MTISQGFTIDKAVDFEEGVEFATRHDFDFVELNMEYTFERGRIDPDRIRRRTEEHGLDTVVHLPYRLDPGSPHEHVRKGACRELEAAIDTGHAYATGQDANGQARLIRKHGDRISHFHLNETRQQDNDEHLPVGFGNIDFATLATALRETGWSGTCSHEIYSFELASRKRSKSAFDELLAGDTEQL